MISSRYQKGKVGGKFEVIRAYMLFSLRLSGAPQK